MYLKNKILKTSLTFVLVSTIVLLLMPSMVFAQSTDATLETLNIGGLVAIGIRPGHYLC